MATDNDNDLESASILRPWRLPHIIKLYTADSQLSRTPINPNWIWHKDKTTPPPCCRHRCRAICPKEKLHDPDIEWLGHCGVAPKCAV